MIQQMGAIGRIVVVAVALGLLGCPVRTRIQDAGTAVDAGPAVVDAGPPRLPDLTWTLRALLPDGGSTEIPLEPGSRPRIDPPVGLELVATIPVKNQRVRVFDEGDRVVPSDDQSDDLQYRIRFTEVLKSGRKYALLVDAQTGPTFLDGFGRAHPDLRVEFQTGGERERPPKKPKRRR